MSDSEKSLDSIWSDWKQAVTMNASTLERWLETDESKAVGQKGDGGESVGHASGRRIVKMLRTNKADLSESDVEHMHKVVGYIHRHLAQKPSADLENSRWRYSLMNWGHDPLEQD
ncbi:DUF3140 domain-containing protein [Arthrobacter sp. Sr33]|uniref:DUF3140 domain-containing protein n=1 Tax=Arthrobacter sp. TB 23 TaxID=494419 RepID=UPI000319260E|nr:DUF3140 domain-containing protein [Arthrobacter sp. TB 23]